MIYSARLILTTEARDHSEATQKFTELTQILVESGYGHVSTTILDDEGEEIADFAV